MKSLLDQENEQDYQKEKDSFFSKGMQRRNFLQYAGASAAGIALVAAGCKKDHHNYPDAVDLGSGDIGILNYAYALEQLEAAFYIKAADAFYSGALSSEVNLISDIRDHEIAHREFFKAALGDKAIGELEFDFSSVNFGSRESVLGTAKAYEDLGVSAYNGAGVLIQDAGYLTIAGKIVSVEARHAAYIRDLIQPGSFFTSEIDQGDAAAGLDIYRKPPEVLMIAGKYIKTKINASNLPS